MHLRAGLFPARTVTPRKRNGPGAMFLTTLVLGLVLGGTYALLALGLTMQYWVARIMNLAYGELTLFAAFTLVLLFKADRKSVV